MQHAKEYVAPPDNVLCKGYKRTLFEKFTCIFEEMKTTSMKKSAIVIEHDFLYHLSKKICDTHLRSVVGERLFRKKDNGNTIILVTVSYHIIAGH